ncbi:MAG TPA: BamA/TamA family outer membrane protein [Longimicrobiales bacterium]|nr:BamA/TamA family outer membrane protein [Longimicrobiales bacterium]
MRLFCVAVMIVLFAGPAMAQDDAYLDGTSREHVRLARERRQVADLSVQRYKVLSKERISAGLRGIRRDRLIYRREVAGRLEWTRNGPAKIEILGAREAIPVALKNVQLPAGLGSFMPHLAFDPADTRMLVGWDDNEFLRHPLAAGAEKYYQYRTGNVTSIQLPSGKVVRLIEIEIIPRKTESHNISGSFWLEAETHAVVRAAFRLAKDIDVIRDMPDEEDDDMEDMPGFLKPLTISIDYVTLDYGLYDLKWWMPRSALFEGHFRAGFMKMPMQYERSYSQYEIEGSDKAITAPIAEVIKRDSAEERADSCRTNVNLSVNASLGRESKNKEARPGSHTVQCGRWTITIPNDTAALLASPELPENVFASGEQLITEGELRELGDLIGKLGDGPTMLPTPITDLSLLSISGARYNRVEGLSIAPHGSVDFGGYKLNALGRIGIADHKPGFELSVDKPGRKHSLTLGAYRRLNGMDPWSRPFSIGSSASALLLGHDEADYYRTLGAELKAEPAGSGARWYSLRLFTQKEEAETKHTDVSLRRVFNGGFVFRPNLQADKIMAHGGELTLRFNHGVNPEGVRLGAEIYTHGIVGDTRFARSALTLRTAFPLPGSFTGALEGAAGLTSSAAPVQHRWYIGGANSLRGYDASVLSGEAFWRGRAEIGLGMPAIKLVAFSDVGWAGARDQYKTAKPLLSVGAGASLLDGIVRFDVARALRAPKGWGLSLYFDAAL